MGRSRRLDLMLVLHVLLASSTKQALFMSPPLKLLQMVFLQMKEAAQCRQFDELRTGDGMVGQVIFNKSHHQSFMRT